MMNCHDVASEIANLNLPAGEYVVVGGACLTMHGIRETEDIDLVVTERLFGELERAGWHLKQRPNGKPGLHRGRVEAYLDVNCGNFERSTEWLLQHSQCLHKIPVIDLTILAAFKVQYGREKDLQDLRLIEKHLASQGQAGAGMHNHLSKPTR